MRALPSVWDLKPLLASESSAEVSKQQKIIQDENLLFINKWQTRDDYLQKAETLKEALDDYERLNHNHAGGGGLAYYFQLRLSQDQNNAQLKAQSKRIEDFSTEIVNQLQFFELRLASIAPKKQEELLSSPLLGAYHHYLQKLFEHSRYLLSEEAEKILNLKSAPASSNWKRLTSSFLAKEESLILGEDGKKSRQTFEQLQSLLSSQNKAVRDGAAKAVNRILKKHAEIAEAEINSVLANKKIDDELRGFKRPDSSRHLGDDIPTETVDLLVEVVSRRYSIAKEYYALKARLHGVPKLRYHERNVPYGELSKTYTFDEAYHLVHQVFTRIDPEFADILQSFTENGQIDVYPRKGKRGGAFCAYGLLHHPVYILLNHTNTLRDVLTLAHECGHGINDELMRQAQHALYYGTPMCTAEVASTFMEDFVLDELLHSATDEMRLAILMAKLNDDISTIFRQIACYQFEQDLHSAFREQGHLSHQAIGQLFQKHMTAYMGDAVEQSPGSENWWIYWQHIRSFFYVYSYASGLLISKSLQKRVKKDGREIGAVKKFLSKGTSQSPVTLFAEQSVDINDRSFWENGLDEVQALLDEARVLAIQLKKI